MRAISVITLDRALRHWFKIRLLLIGMLAATVLIVTPAYALITQEAYYQPEITLTRLQQKTLLNYARARLDGVKQADNQINDLGLSDVNADLIAVLFNNRGKMVWSRRVGGSHTGLFEKVDKALDGAQDHLQSAFIHLMVVSYSGRFPNFGITGLFHNKVYEPRVTGLVYEFEGKRAEITPLYALTYNLNSKLSRSYLAKKLGFDAKQMPSKNDLTIEIYRTIHFGEAYPNRRFTQYFRGHEIFTAGQLTYQELDYRLQLIGHWHKNNVFDGQITYQYGPTQDRYYEDKRSMVRSTMSMWILNRLAYFLNDPELKDLGKETLDYYLERYFNRKASIERGAIIPSSEALPRGDLVQHRWTTAGFVIAAILERGEYEHYQAIVELLVEWIKTYQKDNGEFRTQWGQSQYFMPGQIMLSLAYLYQHTEDESLRVMLEQAFLAYEAPLYQMMKLGPLNYAPYAPAWFTQPFTQLYVITKNPRYRDIVFAINDRVVKWYRQNSEYEVYFDYDGNLEAKPGFYGNNSITSASLESLCDAAYVARLAGDQKRYDRYTQVIRQTTAFLLRLQYTPVNTYYIKHKEKVKGGFKKDLVNNLVWMDNVWHLSSAFMKIQQHQLLNRFRVEQ